VSGQEPDPLEVVLDPSIDEETTDTGRYRGRRRFGKRAQRWAPAWGTGALLAAIGVLLVGSGVLVRTLASAQPDLPPPTSPATSTPAVDERAAAGDRPDRSDPGARIWQTSSPTPTPTAGPATAAAQGSPEPDPPGRGGSGNRPDPAESTDPAPSIRPQASCHVGTELDRWREGYGVNFIITNQGEPLTGWTMTLTVPDGVRLDEGWNGRWSQQGTTLTVENAPFNSTIGTGQSVSTGHRGSHDGELSFSNFMVNGIACTTSTTS
jgi:hypothetical protein